MAEYRVPNLSSFEWQKAVLDKDLAAPPLTPNEGDRYLIASGATGAWLGHDGDLTWYEGGTWRFITKKEGMFVYVKDEDVLYYCDGTNWVKFTGSADADWIIDTVNGVVYNTTDRIAIGTSTPWSGTKLHTNNSLGGLVSVFSAQNASLFVIADDGVATFANSTDTVTLNASRISTGSEVKLRLAGQAGIELASDANTVHAIIDTSGIVSFVNQSACKITASTSQSIPNYTWVKIAFDTKVYDRQNDFDTINNIFTVPVDGLYHINYFLTVVPASNGRFTNAVCKNGNIYITSNYHSSNTYPLTLICSCKEELVAGDYLEFYVWSDNGSAFTTDVSAYRTFVEISKIA